jgi:hypothetical protein
LSYEGKGKTFADKAKELKKALSSPHPLHTNSIASTHHPPPQPLAAATLTLPSAYASGTQPLWAACAVCRLRESLVREQVRLADARQKDEMQFAAEYSESRADGPPEDKVPHPTPSRCTRTCTDALTAAAYRSSECRLVRFSADGRHCELSVNRAPAEPIVPIAPGVREQSADDSLA